MISQRLASFFATGGIAGWMGGRDAETSRRPARVVALTLGFVALLAAPSTGNAANKTPVQTLPPLTVPAPPPPRPTYTDEQKNSWYFQGYAIAAQHPTEFSGFIAEMNDRFGGIAPDRMILILDPDQIYGANGLSSAAVNEHLHFRGNMNSYVWRNGKLLMVHEGLDLLTQMINTRGGVAVHHDVLGQFIHERSKTKAACAVAPDNPDASGLKIAGKIAGLNPAALGNFAGVPAAAAFGGDLLQRWAVYHEAGHCQDDIFNRAARSTQGPERFADSIAGEAFADVYSALLLAQEGHTKFAGQLARLRSLTPAVGGRRLSQLCTADGKLPIQIHNASYGVLSHYSEPALEEAQKFIDSTSPAALKKMDNAAIVAKAAEITKATRLSYDQLMVIRVYLLGGQPVADYMAERAKTGSAADKARHAALAGFIKRADRAVAENAQSSALAQPVWSPEVDESPYIAGYEAFVRRVVARGGTMEALAAEFTATRDQLRAEIAAGDGDQQAKTILLTQITARLINGDDLINDVLHGRYTAQSKAKPTWKIQQQQGYAPGACPVAPEKLNELMDSLDGKVVPKPPARTGTPAAPRG